MSSEFLDMMPQTVTWEASSALSSDGYGAVSYSTGLSIRGRVEQKRRLVRDSGGREVVSTSTVYLDCVTTSSGSVVMNAYDRLTLPSGFLVAGSSQPPIISVARQQDEAGDHHIEVYL